MIVPIGTRTDYGKIIAVGSISGERYYWMKKGIVISMIPAVGIEPEVKILTANA